MKELVYFALNAILEEGLVNMPHCINVILHDIGSWELTAADKAEVLFRLSLALHRVPEVKEDYPDSAWITPFVACTATLRAFGEEDRW